MCIILYRRMTASSAEVCREHILIASLSRQQFANVEGEGEGAGKGAEVRTISPSPNPT